jgi:hypothetical protein
MAPHLRKDIGKKMASIGNKDPIGNPNRWIRDETDIDKNHRT